MVVNHTHQALHNVSEITAGAHEIATLAARLSTTPTAGDALRNCLKDPPAFGRLTLCFDHGKLYRVLREESF